MFPYELDAVFEQIFLQKATSAAAGWPSGGQKRYYSRPHHLKKGKKLTLADGQSLDERMTRQLAKDVHVLHVPGSGITLTNFTKGKD